MASLPRAGPSAMPQPGNEQKLNLPTDDGPPASEEGASGVLGKVVRRGHDLGRNPLRKRYRRCAVGPGRGVLLANEAEVAGIEPGRQANQRWPQSTVNEGYLVVHQPARQHVGVFAD